MTTQSRATVRGGAMNYPQGSEWRKWDLHVHTPASIFHNYSGTETEAWDAFLADLEALPPEFKVLGINDYLFLDGYKRVLAEKAKGRLANIDLILPVIELRLDKFVGHDSHFQRVNFHVIFDAIDPEIIETQFISSLPRDFRLLPDHESLKGRWAAVPTRKSLTDFGQLIINAAPPEKKAQYGPPLQEGFNNFNVTLDNVQKALDSTYFKGKHLIAVGKTEWDAIKWSDASIAEKRNVINNADIVFTSAANVAAFHKAQDALKKANVNSRLLDCSDGHCLSSSTDKDRIGNSFTWIKADTTFAGLQHAIKEYDKRVFVGDAPDKIVRVQANPTRYIKDIKIKKVSGSALTENWFDCDLPVNKDLVAIIGNKGSGKSALADALGLLGDTKQSAHFSFLNDEKFRDPRDNKASHFEATLTWESGTSTTKQLDSDPDPDSIETIKYLPQNYIETLCNEIVSGGDGEFDRELKKIIFSHVGPSERFGHDTLDDVIHYLTSETQATIRVQADRVHKINQDIVLLEERNTESFRTQLESQLRIKREELEAHERSKPVAVPEPAQSDELKQAAAIIRAEIGKRKEEAGLIVAEIAKLDKERIELTRNIAVIDKAITKLDNFGMQYEEFKRELTDDLRELSINPPIRFEDVSQFSVDRAKLTRVRSKIMTELSEIDQKLDSTKEGTPVSRKCVLEEEVKKLQDSLDEPNRKFVAYHSAVEAWAKKRGLIEGDVNSQNSIAWLEHRLEDLTGIPAKLQELQQKRKAMTVDIYRETKKLSDSYSRLYHPVQAFVEQHKIALEIIPLSFQVSIVEEGFANAFLEKINRQVRGTFSGLEESSTFIRKRLKTVDFDNEESVTAFIDEIDSSLHIDKRPGVTGEPKVLVKDQLRKGETPLSVYDYLYSLSFLTPRYTLRYGGHEIHQLSPGERGLLLLVFYLLIDNERIPLVIDQPEENLDNQTIYQVLVHCLSIAKHHRQVIIVTHNPNLAVVCDAEQVIHAQRDTTLNAITYDSGGIENPAINKHVIDVLEGTRPAFKNRDSKYFAV
jgi:ABC-type lipoprotein export system ATPase subunit